MHLLPQNLIITYSNQKARDLKRSTITNAFDKVTTLEGLILEIFEKHHTALIIDEITAPLIIYKIIRDEKIAYFDYLQSDAVSLTTIFNFIVKCHSNDVAFERLLSEAKLEALLQIDTAYQTYKANHGLVDIADIEERVLSAFDMSFFDTFTEVFVDNFAVGEINFIKSKKQEQIFSKLSHFKVLTQAQTLAHENKLISTKGEVFDTIDEVKTAIKIARKLLQEGASAEDILIVASDISEYAPLYKLFLAEYGMRGFSSTGTPLSHYFNTEDERVQRAMMSYKSELKTLTQLCMNLGLEFSQQAKENLKANIRIGDERVGIELTEPNQLIGLSKSYKNIIFMGTDINHFPPTSNDNFLYSYEEELEYFYANNYFASSQTHLNELKRLSENLYIITASYSGKRELSRSILIGKSFDGEIDADEIQSINDLALHEQTYTPDLQTQEYYESINSEAYTKYDGAEIENIEAKHLSASQINKYLSCPLAYFYSNKLKLKAPKQTEEGFDAMEQGSLMHLCYELFGREIQAKNIISIESEELYTLMYQKSLEAFAHEDTTKNIEEPNIHHQIFLGNLQAGLQDERAKGLLAKFVDYYIAHAEEFEYFKNSAFEKEFALDYELKPYTLKDKEDKNYFIRGFIDRFDELSEHINIIDYKSKKMSTNIDKAKQEQVENLKDVQLALYLLYASQQYPDKDYKAHLLSFKGNNPYYHFANLSTIEGEKYTVHYSDIYHEQLKQVIHETKNNIEAGAFAFNNEDEKACGYCDMKFICHEGVLNKQTTNEIVI